MIRIAQIVVAAALLSACASTPSPNPDLQAQPLPVAEPTEHWVPAFAAERASLVQRPDLNVSYRDCVRDAGFDLDFAQVLVGSSGVPMWVKTGRNVPNEFHGPCFEEIGGEATDATSWGVPLSWEPDG